MRRIALAVATAAVCTLSLCAQQPGPPGGGGGGASRSPAELSKSAVERMLTLDANRDGKLTKEEVTDTRLSALLARADANRDGTVSREELVVLFTQEAASLPAGRRPGGPGGPKGPPPQR